MGCCMANEKYEDLRKNAHKAVDKCASKIDNALDDAADRGKFGEKLKNSPGLRNTLREFGKDLGHSIAQIIIDALNRRK